MSIMHVIGLSIAVATAVFAIMLILGTSKLQESIHIERAEKNGVDKQ